MTDFESRRVTIRARHAGRVEAQRDVPACRLVCCLAGQPGIRGQLALGTHPPLGEIHERATLPRHREVRRPRGHEPVTLAERYDEHREAGVDLRGGRDLDVAGEKAAALEPRAQLRQAGRGQPTLDEREREAPVGVPGRRQDAPVRVDAEHRRDAAGCHVGVHEDARHERVVDHRGGRLAGRGAGRGRGARRGRRVRCRGGLRRFPGRARGRQQGGNHDAGENPHPTRRYTRCHVPYPLLTARPGGRTVGCPSESRSPRDVGLRALGAPESLGTNSNAAEATYGASGPNAGRRSPRIGASDSANVAVRWWSSR